MKTRLIFAALLLLTFGKVKAQDTIYAPNGADTIQVVMPDMSQLPALLNELNVNLQHLFDSVDWENFEQGMEQWGKEMEEWGRRMEQWGENLENNNGEPNNPRPLRNDGPQVRAIQVEGSGDVRITQSPEQFSLARVDDLTSNYEVVNGTLVLRGSSDYEVSIQQLDEVIMRSSGDVTGRGTIKGHNLNIIMLGSGDIWLDVDYDTITVKMSSSGDVTLKGQCKMIYADILGSGDLLIPQLLYAESHINATGSGEAVVNGSRNNISHTYHQDHGPCHRTLLFDAHWNGFEAGLNMLFDTPADVVNSNNGAQGMELRPLRSWYFGFNIADMGVAFDRRHTVGMFTGVGIGWNNFSWNNDVTIEYDPDIVVYTLVPIESDQVVKNTKHGALFLEVPLMLEVRPTHHMYIDAGVTGGLRFAQWNRVKLADGTQHKHYYSSGINRFKLDASLRVGGENLGFFANYALLPIFDMGNAEVHPLSFGFSLNF